MRLCFIWDCQCRVTFRLTPGIAVNEMNVGVSLSEPDTLCFTVSGELDNGSFIMQPVKRDGKALHAFSISAPV